MKVYGNFRNDKNKTVYVLGAGFSAAAKAPMQDRIIAKIFETFDEQDEKLQKFTRFLKDVLFIDSSQFDKIALEDIFTPLDRCLLENVSFRKLSIQEVKEERENIIFLIGKTLQNILASPDKECIDTFARHLVNESKIRKKGGYKKYDPVSVITTNWDILLDTSIKEAIRQIDPDGHVDYLCHISSFNEHDKTVMPGLEALGQGKYIVKLLKLHGSLNWIQCPKCNRLYADFDSKIAVDQFLNPQFCRHCLENFKTELGCRLESNIVMPTFLKNLSNTQLKLIWQNAGIELSEASKIIFIGYSLPQADFEIRQLMARTVRETAEIEVVTLGSKGDEGIKDMISRYKVFFGKRKFNEPFFEGTQKYIENNL